MFNFWESNITNTLYPVYSRVKLIQPNQLETWRILYDIAGYSNSASEKEKEILKKRGEGERDIRFHNVVCMALHRRWRRAAVTCKYVQHVWSCVRGITYGTMCRIYVAPSRRPSDVLLGSRNSALHSYRVTYVMRTARARAYIYIYMLEVWRDSYIHSTCVYTSNDFSFSWYNYR